jgi:hypothetical protein
MGWKGALRSINAARNRAERESVTRHRQLQRLQATFDKLEAHQQALQEMACFVSLLARLTSIHRECGERVDWRKLKNAPSPAQPQHSRQGEQAAQHALSSYQPSWLDRLIGRVERKQRDLTEAVERAKREDTALHEQVLANFRVATTEWQETVQLAERILSLDPEAFGEAVAEMSPLQELEELGSNLQFQFHPQGVIEATLRVQADSVIPKESKSVLKSGKLSVKKMPTGEYWELYQDYVAGAVLRVARELDALLPAGMLVVTAVADLLNTSTGYVEEQPILSVQVPPASLARLNFATLDASDGLRNFVHRMDFRRSKGLGAIEPLTLT